MEKEIKAAKTAVTEKNANYCLESNTGIGSVKIANDVVAMIAGLAATEVDGVSAMVGNISNELMSMVGMKNLSKGVKVEILNGVVSVDLAVTLDYGYNIPGICAKVQEKVKNAIENMTGLEVSEVNLRIAAINLANSKN